MAGNPVWKVERNINYCRENTTQIHLYHTVNMAVMIYQFEDEIQTMQLSVDTLSPVPIELDPDEPAFQEAEKDKIAKQQGKPLLLEEAMSSIKDTKYLTGEDYVLEMNSVDTLLCSRNVMLYSEFKWSQLQLDLFLIFVWTYRIICTVCSVCRLAQ